MYILLLTMTCYLVGQVRAWTIQTHTKAPQAAGTIHTDMERGFIKAEVYKYEDLVELKTEAGVKAGGTYNYWYTDYSKINETHIN